MRLIPLIQTLMVSVIAALCGVSVAAANMPEPRVKPAPVNYSQLLGEQDFMLFKRAMNEADSGDWATVRQIKSQISDKVAQDMLTWREAVENPNAPFEVLAYTVTNLPHWPRMVTVKAKAEDELWKDRRSSAYVLKWFDAYEPVSGEGRAALARAYFQSGDTAKGTEWIRYAWREARLSRNVQIEIYGDYKQYLRPEDHAARADHLIWLGRRYFTMAEALLPMMDDADAKLHKARIYVGTNRSGMNSAINAIPATLETHPGLLYERGHWRRVRRSYDYALPMFITDAEPPAPEHGKEKMWNERKRLAYWAISEGRFSDAYKLTLNHGMTGGVDFAEAEFLGGWLALTKLNQPVTAATRFQTLSNGVSFPVSKSRADYWLGRAYEAAGDSRATTAYLAAAEHLNTFYGQLAIEKVYGNGSMLTLPAQLTAGDSTLFRSSDVIKALMLAGEVRHEFMFRRFAFHLDDELASPVELSHLAELAREYGYWGPSVRAGKQAARFNAVLTEDSYPIPEPFRNLGPQYDLPFVLAIARQESEFELDAISSARAYGMMQMINSTASMTARMNNKPYKQFWLVSDPDYSVSLGADHLNDLLEEFDGSYILAAAAYNAGSHRVRQWLRTYGDPRKGEIDPIDWMESIPFTETRNYVQRVMENLAVYRARLSNNSAPLTIERDLNRG